MMMGCAQIQKKKDKHSQGSNLLNSLLNFQIIQQSSQKTGMKDMLQTQLSTILLLNTAAINYYYEEGRHERGGIIVNQHLNGPSSKQWFP